MSHARPHLLLLSHFYLASRMSLSLSQAIAVRFPAFPSFLADGKVSHYSLGEALTNRQAEGTSQLLYLRLHLKRFVSGR